MKTAVFTYQQDAHKKYLWDKDTLLSNYNAPDLEILIATMNREDLSFLEFIFSKPVDLIDENILIINQSKTVKLSSPFSNIRVINDEAFGLSRSRNIAIKNSRGKLNWILDDDCKVKNTAVETIVKAFNNIPATVITFQTEILETGELYWNYPKGLQPLDGINLKKTLSPEIVFRKGVIGDTYWFDERFGLGAQFKDGENYLFLKNLFFNDISAIFVNQTIVYHAQYQSSMEICSERLLYARGAIAKEDGKNIFFQKWKYALFLLRKRLVVSPSKLWSLISIFQKGADDFKKTEKA